MTESEWNGCTDPQNMLEFLQGKASNRKLRLFACACCRNILHLNAEDAVRKAVETAERYAEGMAPEQERKQVSEEVWKHVLTVLLSGPSLGASVKAFTAHAAVRALMLWHDNTDWMRTNAADPAGRAVAAERWSASRGEPTGKKQVRDWKAFERVVIQEQSVIQCGLLREIIRTPCLAPIDSLTLTPPVVKEAQAIYSDRAFDRLPILADALADSGCTQQDILGHLRSGGVHVLGCWALDLIVGKE